MGFGGEPWMPWALAGIFLLAMVLAKVQVNYRNKKKK